MPALQGFAPDTPPAIRTRVLVVLGLAVLGISSSAVLVRGMEDIGPVAIAAWRCLGSALLLSPGIALAAKTLSGRDLAKTAASGAFLGLHFATWFASLYHTTVLRSTVLVALVPVWTGLLEWAWKGERPTARYWLGVGAAVAGVVVLGTTIEQGDAGLTGDLLAAFAGVLWAVYFLIGRDVRQRVEITGYMGLVCGFAAVCLFPATVVMAEPLTGFPTWTWVLLLGAILGPQLMGHQGSSYAVRYLPARVVSTVMLLEPVGATLLAWAFLGEQPPVLAAVAALLILGGVGLATAGGDVEEAEPPT